MTRESNMINNILKGWLNINKLVKIFVYDLAQVRHMLPKGAYLPILVYSLP
jgi:hypothetical protein